MTRSPSMADMWRFGSLLLAFVLLMAPGATADEEPAAPSAEDGAQPLLAVPDFGLQHVLPEGDAYPTGWQPAGDGAHVPLTAETVRALARGGGPAAEDVLARCRTMRRPQADGALRGVACWIAIEKPAPGFARSVRDVAAARGWAVREIGGPMRLLVAWGSTPEAANTILAWQVEEAVRRLVTLAVRTIERTHRASDVDSARSIYERGERILEAAGRTEPRAGLYHAWKGRMAASLAAGSARRGDREGHARHEASAVEHYRKALAKEAVVLPPAKMVPTAAFTAGQALMLMEDPAVLDEARHVLTQGVEHERHAKLAFHRFANRYNLACLHARRGDFDRAFEQLDASLAYLKGAWLAERGRGASSLGYPFHYQHAAVMDGDLAPLREDARWAPLMKRHRPAPEGD